MIEKKKKAHAVYTAVCKSVQIRWVSCKKCRGARVIHCCTYTVHIYGKVATGSPAVQLLHMPKVQSPFSFSVPCVYRSYHFLLCFPYRTYPDLFTQYNKMHCTYVYYVYYAYLCFLSAVALFNIVSVLLCSCVVSFRFVPFLRGVCRCVSGWPRCWRRRRGRFGGGSPGCSFRRHAPPRPRWAPRHTCTTRRA